METLLVFAGAIIAVLLIAIAVIEIEKKIIKKKY
jgi:hypothetical protein